MEKRPPYLNAWSELSEDKAMVFLVGPRQAGKTTLAKMIAELFTNSFYWNWDIAEHRKKLFEDAAFFTRLVRKDKTKPFVILD